MLVTLLTTALLGASPVAALPMPPPPTSTVVAPVPAGASPGTSAAPGAPAASASFSSPQAPSLGVTAWVVPTLLLGALSAAAGVLVRRRPRLAGGLRVVGSTSLGPKRSITVVQTGDTLLVLGVSEAGIALLKEMPAPVEPAAPELPSLVVRAHPPVLRAVPPAPGPGPSTGSGSGAGTTMAARPTGAHRAVAAARPDADPFADLLAESAEDQELRRKLAHGIPGSVR